MSSGGRVRLFVVVVVLMAGSWVDSVGPARAVTGVTVLTSELTATLRPGSDDNPGSLITNGLVTDGNNVTGTVEVNENGYTGSLSVNTVYTETANELRLSNLSTWSVAIPSGVGVFHEMQYSLQVGLRITSPTTLDVTSSLGQCGGLRLADPFHGTFPIDALGVSTCTNSPEVNTTVVLQPSDYILDIASTGGLSDVGGSGGGVFAFELVFRPSPCTKVGTNGKDVLNGTTGNDVICGLGGDDTIDGKGGNDKIFGGTGDDVLLGGPGDDLIVGCIGNDTIDGGGGDDEIRGGYPLPGQKSDGCESKPTNDGRERVLGGAGDDLIDSGTQSDLVIAGDGDDEVRSGRGDDIVNGGDGIDLLIDDEGTDRLTGCDGSDTIVGGRDKDLLAGGRPLPGFFPPSGTVVRGVDARICSADVAGQKNSVDGGSGDDEVYGDDKSADKLVGGSGVDLLNGFGGKDELDGGANNDALRPGKGADSVLGGDGDDTIFAQDSARDVIDGGAGRDKAAVDVGVDQLTSIEKRF